MSANLIVRAVNHHDELVEMLVSLNAQIAAWRVTGQPNLGALARLQDETDELLRKVEAT